MCECGEKGGEGRLKNDHPWTVYNLRQNNTSVVKSSKRLDLENFFTIYSITCILFL